MELTEGGPGRSADAAGAWRDAARLTDAVKARGAFFKTNKDTLTMKQARRTLEQDIGLSPKFLDADEWKEQVASLVDKALFGESEAEIVSTSEAVSPAKRMPPEQPEGQMQSDASGDSDEERPQKKAKKSSKKQAAPAPKKAATVSRGSSARAAELKKTLAACTIKLPPTTYTKCASEEEFVTRLEGLLAKEGLGANPSREQIVKVKRRLEQARELDGIDVSNVIQPGSRRRAAQNHVLFDRNNAGDAAAGAAPKPAPKPAASSDSSDVSSDSDDDSDEEDGSIGNSDSDDGRIDTSSKSKSKSKPSGAGLPVRTQQMPMDDDCKKPVAAPAVKTVVVKAAAAATTTAPAAAAVEQKAELAKMEAAARGRRTFVIDDSDDE